MGIPLVRNNSVDDINTSIIAIKKELGKGGSGDMGDVNVNVKYEVTDTVEDGNSLPVTSQGVYDYVEGQGFTPVDEVTKNNMKAVTSNAVAESLSYSTTEQKTGGVWIDGKMIYRKVAHVWHNNAPVSPYTLVNNHLSFWPSNDAEMITNYRGICIRTDGYVDVFVSGISVGTGMVPNLTNKNIYFNGLGTTQWSDGWIVIEYTKTTD